MKHQTLTQHLAEALRACSRRSNGMFVLTQESAGQLATFALQNLQERIGGQQVYIPESPRLPPEAWRCKSGPRSQPGTACALGHELKGEIERLARRMEALESRARQGSRS